VATFGANSVLHSTDLLIYLATATLLSLVGCGQENTHHPLARAAGIDAQLHVLIDLHVLTGDPSTGRDLPSINDPLAQLGKQLFFTKALGGDYDVACVSCHHPLLGGGDGLSLSVGVGAEDADILGPGRRHDHEGRGAIDPDADGGPNVPRNAPTTFNVAFYDIVLFHDGRIESVGRLPGLNGADSGIITPDSLFRSADPNAGANLVEAQARFPLISEDEMLGYGFPQRRRGTELRTHLSGRLGDYGAGRGELGHTAWLAEFRRVFGWPGAAARSLITFANINRAIAAYQRSQVFVDTPWKKYIGGDFDALSDTQKRGALLFFRTREQGGAACARCHAGDFFTDEQFHVLAMPQLGRGKTNGPYRDHDNGRFKVSRRAEDKYAFRTPSLLNVAVTGPYSHSGAYDSLREVVRHHLDPLAAVADYDYSLQRLRQFSGTGFSYPHARENTERALAKLLEDSELRADSDTAVELSDEQFGDLVVFLHALTDPCVTDPQCLAPWLPDPDAAGPDGLQLNAVIARIPGNKH